LVAAATVRHWHASFDIQFDDLNAKWQQDEKAGVPASALSPLQERLATLQSARWMGISVSWLAPLDGAQKQLLALESQEQVTLKQVTAQNRTAAQKAMNQLEQTMGKFASAGHSQRATELQNASTPKAYTTLTAQWDKERADWNQSVADLKAASGGLHNGKPADILQLDNELQANLKTLPAKDEPTSATAAESDVAKYWNDTPQEQLQAHADLKRDLNKAISDVKEILEDTSSEPPGSNPLGFAFANYVENREGQVSVALYDAKSGHTYSYQPNVSYDTASIVKATIMADLLHQAEVTGQPLTDKEKSLMVPMIEESDNDAASTLWSDAGSATGIENFLKAAGLSSTTPGLGGYWGLTSTTAMDEMNLMKLYAFPNSLLDDSDREYGLNLMENVVDWEDWGVSTGPQGNATVALKNGWSPASDDDWRINSIGYVEGDGRDYVIAVLTQDNPSEDYGIDTIDEISQLIWEALG